MRQKILVDMDGVLADVYAQFINFEYRDTGIKKGVEELKGITEAEAFPLHHEHLNSQGFFGTAPLIEGSVEGLRYLNEKYDILVVSSATEFPNSLRDKYDWLQIFSIYYMEANDFLWKERLYQR